MKKGQISYFLLVALILLISSSFIFYFNSTSSEKPKSQNSFGMNLDPIKNYLNNCVKITSEDAVTTLGWQGGLIIYDENRMITTHFGAITYAYKDRRNTFPSKQEMEKQLELYTDIILARCIENLSSYQGWELEKEKIDTHVSINENSVLFNINYPIKLKKEKTVEEFSEFRTEVPVRLGYIHSAINSIIEKQVKEPGWIPFTNLNEFDVNVTFYPYKKNNFIYEFVDDKSLIKNEPYRFLVANMFEEVNLDEIT